MKTILIVDDQVEIRDLLDITLRADKCKILQSTNGMEALEMAEKEVPDLIIMDIMMPGELDGLEATRRIKSNPKTQECTLLLLTGLTKQADIERGIMAGADGYFTKPFSPLELIQKINEVFQSK